MSDDNWLTDRSRMVRGETSCERARYLEYHSGPTSHGIRRKSDSLPLVTGSAIHDIMAGLLRGEEPKALIKGEAERYRKRCASRGFLELAEEEGGEEILRIVEEQAALIEGFGWAATMEYVPALLEEYEVVLVEQELLLPLADGIVLMSRPDAILRRKVDSTLIQLESKSTGWMSSKPWRRQWEDSKQLLLTKLAAEAHLKEKVTFAYIFAFDKSKRSEEKATGQVKQWSPLLYAYHKEANPPMEEEDWQTKWKWVDEEGRNHTLGKKYQRQAVFTYPFAGLLEGMSPVEYWVRSLPPVELQAQREILGPFTFLDHVADSILRAAGASEERWRTRLWKIHQAGEEVGWDETHEDFIRTLDEEVPQSWNCHAFGGDCPYLSICKREPGWEDPLSTGRFELRTPHHPPELEAAKARGIELPEDQEEEGGEE